MDEDEVHKDYGMYYSGEEDYPAVAGSSGNHSSEDAIIK